MSSHDMENPYGGVNMGHVMESPDPDEHLLERILSRENMQKAWKQSLLAGTYQPLPVRRVEIPKPTGGTRPLGIPSVMDRLIQQAIYQGLMPLFDPDFSDCSYGFRPGRSAHDAVYQARKYIQQGYRVARSRPSWLTSYWMTWTKSLKDADTGSFGTRMTSSYW